MLAQWEVAGYLLRKGHLSAAEIVDGDVQVVETSRRNRNLKVVNELGRSYLLKQGVGANKTETIAHESAVYQYFEGMGEDEPFRAHLPRYYGYDRDDGILLLELLNDAVDFREYHLRRGHFSTSFAAELGASLSRLHSLTRSNVMPGEGTRFAGKVPWVLSLHRPGLALFKDASVANLKLIRILQGNPDLPRMLDRLRSEWRVDGLIHHDIKWENCLVIRRGKPKLRLIDWEFAALGDRAWDAGSVFSSYLSCWLFSIPVSGEEPPDHFLELAGYPLDRMQPALRAYWNAYVRGMGLQGPDLEESLVRSLRYAGARLVQTGFEQMQYATQLTGNVVCILQLGLNIMQRPHEAAVQLLGLSLT